MSALTMIVQPINVDIAFNEAFVVEPEMMKMIILSEENNFEPHEMGYPVDEYHFEEAVYIQTWQLPNEVLKKNMKWTSLDLTKVRKTVYDVSLLNVKTGEFELQDTGNVKITEDIGDYLSPEGKVVFRIAFHESRNGNSMGVPELRLSGVVAQ